MTDSEFESDEWGGMLEGMQRLYDTEQAKADDLAQQLAIAEGRARRVRNAMSALRESTAAPRGRKTTATATAARGGTYQRRVGEEVRERILNTILGQGDKGVTVVQAHEFTGLSMDTTRRGIYQLRDEGIIRKAGVNSERAIVYKPMPEHMPEKTKTEGAETT